MEIVAAVGRSRGEAFSIESMMLESPRADEVLVKVVATGMCHTDLAVRDGDIPYPPYPHVLGHEGAGVVLATGPGVVNLTVGDPVVMSYASCGSCTACRAGEPYDCQSFFTQNFGGHRPDGSCCHSQHGKSLHGNFFGQSSFASHALVRERNLVKVPQGLPLDLMAPLGCGIITGAGAVLNVLKPPPHSSVAIFGLGAVGMSAVMAARLVGVRTIIAVDLLPTRRALAKDLGATHALNPGDGPLAEQVREITGGGADYMVEAIGNADLIDGFLAAVRSRGSAVLLGAQTAGAKITFDAQNLMRGMTVRAVVEGASVPHVMIPRLIDRFLEGRFPFDRLIRTYDFKDINQAAIDMASGLTIKPVLRMADPASPWEGTS